MPTAAGLFSPFRLGGLTVRNRFVMAPMTRQRSLDGVPGPDVAEYYRRRAAGGVGLILTEGTYIDHPTAVELADAPRLFGRDALRGWQGVVAGVHAEGGAIAAQLWHAGAERDPVAGPLPGHPRLSPSGLSLEGMVTGTPMSAGQMREVVSAYARSAAVAQGIGFDGVEIHAAHGYLLDEFLWERTNLRADDHGGRSPRFVADVVGAVRDAVGPQFPITVRVSQWKLRNYDARSFATPERLAAALGPLAEVGATAFHASTRRHWEPAFPGSPMGLAGWVRQVTGRPTIAVGSVGLGSAYVVDDAGGRSRRHDLEDVQRQFAAAEFDLVAVGRALLHDPRWVEKIRDGRVDEISDFDPRALDTLT